MSLFLRTDTLPKLEFLFVRTDTLPQLESIFVRTEASLILRTETWPELETLFVTETLPLLESFFVRTLEFENITNKHVILLQIWLFHLPTAPHLYLELNGVTDSFIKGLRRFVF